MSLDALIRSAVSLASGIYQGAKSPVQHVAWLGQSGTGTPITATVTRYPVLAFKRMQHQTKSGKTVEVRAILTFLEPIPDTAANAGFVRVNPIDARDRFVLPDGSSGPIVDVLGVYDATKGAPFYSRVMLGVAS